MNKLIQDLPPHVKERAHGAAQTQQAAEHRHPERDGGTGGGGRAKLRLRTCQLYGEKDLIREKSFQTENFGKKVHAFKHVQILHELTGRCKVAAGLLPVPQVPVTPSPAHYLGLV